MNRKKTPLGTLLGKIENTEDMESIIREVSIAFLVLGSIQIIGGIFLFPVAIFDGILYVGLSVILKKSKSRVAAIILLMLTLTVFFLTIMNKIDYSQSTGTNIVLALIITFLAIRSVEATFKLNKLKSNQSDMSL